MSEPNDSVARILDGRSWEEFCDTLKAAGSVVLSETSPDDPFNRAEGWRYLTRLTRAAFESFVESGDAQAPEFRRGDPGKCLPIRAEDAPPGPFPAG